MHMRIVMYYYRFFNPARDITGTDRCTEAMLAPSILTLSRCYVSLFYHCLSRITPNSTPMARRPAPAAVRGRGERVTCLGAMPFSGARKGLRSFVCTMRQLSPVVRQAHQSPAVSCGARPGAVEHARVNQLRLDGDLQERYAPRQPRARARGGARWGRAVASQQPTDRPKHSRAHGACRA